MSVLEELLALGWPRALITLEEWDTLPQDNETKVECVEGMVVPMAPPDKHHQRAIARLLTALSTQLPADREVLPEVGVILEAEPLTIRIPDLSIVAFDDEHRTLFRAADIRLAVEVVSPGSSRVDRVTKFSEYADAGVAEYWILDRDDLVLRTFVLGADGYRLTGEHRGAATISTCAVSVSLDVSRLV